MSSALAKMSVEDFVKGFVRPEIAWNIFSYVAEDPHKDGIIKSQFVRRVFKKKVRKTKTFVEEDGKIVSATEDVKVVCKWVWSVLESEPYKMLIDTYDRDDDAVSIFTGNTWLEDWHLHEHSVKGDFDHYKLKYTNKLLHSLWQMNLRNISGKSYLVSKKDLAELCKTNNIKGFTRFLTTPKKDPVSKELLLNQRHSLISALIKL
jgi:hypothetical protein